MTMTAVGWVSTDLAGVPAPPAGRSTRTYRPLGAPCRNSHESPQAAGRTAPGGLRGGRRRRSAGSRRERGRRGRRGDRRRGHRGLGAAARPHHHDRHHAGECPRGAEAAASAPEIPMPRPLSVPEMPVPRSHGDNDAHNRRRYSGSPGKPAASGRMAAVTTTDVPPLHLEFAVAGMSCGSCAARVERILVGRPGVVSASVNLATHRATVHVLPGAANAVRELTEAVERAGYQLSPATDRERPQRVGQPPDAGPNRPGRPGRPSRRPGRPIRRGRAGRTGAVAAAAGGRLAARPRGARRLQRLAPRRLGPLDGGRPHRADPVLGGWPFLAGAVGRARARTPTWTPWWRSGRSPPSPSPPPSCSSARACRPTTMPPIPPAPPARSAATCTTTWPP